jgi:hypothetical protein
MDGADYVVVAQVFTATGLHTSTHLDGAGLPILQAGELEALSIYDVDGTVLASAGETCDNVPTEALAWLLADGFIELAS